MTMLTNAQREATNAAVSRIVANRIEKRGIAGCLKDNWTIRQEVGCPTRLIVEMAPIYISRWELAEISRALETGE
jgi:hypothetical protein